MNLPNLSKLCQLSRQLHQPYKSGTQQVCALCNVPVKWPSKGFLPSDDVDLPVKLEDADEEAKRLGQIYPHRVQVETLDLCGHMFHRQCLDEQQLQQCPVCSTPILEELQGSTIQMLRNEQHADEKNDRMMAILNTKSWWIEYKREFDARRKLDEDRFNAGLPRSTDPYPRHPSKKVYEIEAYVDAQMRLEYPDYVSGRR